MSNQKGGANVGPITEEQIKAAIARSGYPLEIQLATAFEHHGMKVTFGCRVGSPRSDALREMDLVAEMERLDDLDVPGGEPGATTPMYFRMAALAQVKAMPPSMAFVGFPWRQPNLFDLRTVRSRLGGTPSANVVPEYESVWHREPGPMADNLWTSLDALSEGLPVCHQWAVVHRKDGKPEHKAEHLGDYWDDISNVVEAAEWLLHEDSIGCVPLIRMGLVLPTLIVGTPSLHLFDVNTQELRQTDQLILAGTFDLGGGRAETRLVDVVTANGLAAMISRYRKAFNDAVWYLRRHSAQVYEAAAKQASAIGRSKRSTVSVPTNG